MKKTILALAFGLLFGTVAQAQVLDVDPDTMGKPVEREAHTGLALTGSTGLVTMPTPDFKKDHPVAISSRSGISRQDSTIGTSRYRISKFENYSGLSYFLKENLELSLNHLYYKRSSKAYLKGLDQRESNTGFGMKYSTKHGKQDLCFGISYTPMSAEDVAKADLSQIENLRNVYMTITEDLAPDLRGYLHAKACSTRDQKIDMGNGNFVRLSRKDFLASAVGLEYAKTSQFALIGEAQFFNYRDIFKDESSQYSINAGIRFGAKLFQLEAMGLSLNQNPRLYLGGNIGF
jgi:hypothetical protein